MEGDAINSMVMTHAIIGGLFGTLIALGVPLFFALLVTGVNVRASVSAYALWLGFLAITIFGAMGGNLYHALNAGLAYALISSVFVVPVLAFVFSRLPPWKWTAEDDTTPHVFGQDAYAAHTRMTQQQSVNTTEHATLRSAPHV